MIDRSWDVPHDLRHHPFTWQQAQEAGLTRAQLHRAVDARWVRRPFRGVYVPATIPDSIETRCEALALSVPDSAFVCDHSASWLHAGDRALVPGDHQVVPEVSCFHPRPGARLRRATVRSGERDVRPDEIVELNGLLVTTPFRTALDIGRLARNNDIRLHGMDTMLSLGLFEREDLVAEVERFKGFRGVVGLRALAPLADAGAESFGESALRLRWHQAHLPWPTTQVVVPGPFGEELRLDLGLPELWLSTEYDGEDYHSTDDQVEHDRQRRLWLRSQGWTLETFGKEQVFGRHQVAEQRLRATYAALVAGRQRRTYF